MMPVTFHPRAAQEARRAASHYRGINTPLGDDFATKLNDGLCRVRETPLMFAAERDEVRICPLRRFPFSIVFQIIDESIWIVAIAHHRRRSRYWARRIRA